MGLTSFLSHGFSQSEGSKMFEKYQKGIKSIKKAGAAYKQAVSEGNPEKAMTIKSDITKLDKWLTQMKPQLESAEYDFSDKLYATLGDAKSGITFGGSRAIERSFAEDDAAKSLVDAEYNQNQRILGKGISGGLLGDTIPEELGSVVSIGKLAKGGKLLFNSLKAARTKPARRQLLKETVSKSTTNPKQKQKFFDAIDSGKYDDASPEMINKLYKSLPANVAEKVAGGLGKGAKKVVGATVTGAGIVGGGAAYNALTGGGTAGQVRSLLTGDRGETKAYAEGGPVRGNRAGVSAEQIARGHENLPTPRQMLEFIPIVGDILGAEEIYRELQKSEPNWPLIGALTGATVIGLVPGIGDAAAAGIKAGARAGLKGVKGGIELAKRIEVDPNAVGSFGGNIRLKPKKGYTDDGLGDSGMTQRFDYDDSEIYRQSIPTLSERAEAAIRAGHSSPMIEKARGLGDVRPEMVAKVDYDQDWNFNPEVLENIRIHEREQGIKKAQERAWLRTLSPAERKEYSLNKQMKQERNLDYTPTEAEMRSSKPDVSKEELYDKDYLDAARLGPHSGSSRFGGVEDYEPWHSEWAGVDANKLEQRSLPFGNDWEGLTNLRTHNIARQQTSIDSIPDSAWGNWSEFKKIADSKPPAEREKLMAAWRDRDLSFEGVNPYKDEAIRGQGPGILSGHRSVRPDVEDLEGLLTENELFRSGLLDDPRKNPWSESYIEPPSHPPNLEAIIKDTKPPKRIQNAEELHSAYDKVISKNPNITPEEFAELLDKNETSFGQGIFETFDVSDWDKGEATLRTKIDSPETQANKAKKMIAQFIKLRNTPGAREAYLAKEAKKKANMAARQESGATGLLF